MAAVFYMNGLLIFLDLSSHRDIEEYFSVNFVGNCITKTWVLMPVVFVLLGMNSSMCLSVKNSGK